ncbi:MAG: RHS repeat protein, partial [Chloroflexi bacterium]
GEFVVGEAPDLKIAGRGIDYEFRRTYKSQISYRGPLGANWQHNYDQFLVPTGTNLLVVDGYARADLYTSTNGITFTSPAGFYDRLLKNGDNSYTLRNPHGALATFGALDGAPAQGRLTRIADRNGNALTYQYDSLGRLARVNDTLGRPITYTYNLSGFLDAVLDFSGRRLRFGYDANGNLISVTLPAVTGTPNGNDFPNGKTWRYSYASGFGDERLNHNLLSSVAPNEVADGSLTPRVVNTYGTAGYDFDRVTMQAWGGVNGSGVPAGGVITLTYQQLNPLGDPNDLSLPRNRTTVFDRNGNQKVYEHNVNGHRLSL